MNMNNLMAQAQKMQKDIQNKQNEINAMSFVGESEWVEVTLKGNKTIIVIAHRLCTLKECDKLIYINDGAIVDIGTFEELEKSHDDFKNLIKLSQI